jgi:hypothetical protein
MANENVAFGLKPVRMADGSPYAGGVDMYYVPSPTAPPCSGRPGEVGRLRRHCGGRLRHPLRRRRHHHRRRRGLRRRRFHVARLRCGFDRPLSARRPRAGHPVRDPGGWRRRRSRGGGCRPQRRHHRGCRLDLHEALGRHARHFDQGDHRHAAASHRGSPSVPTTRSARTPRCSSPSTTPPSRRALPRPASKGRTEHMMVQTRSTCPAFFGRASTPSSAPNMPSSPRNTRKIFDVRTSDKAYEKVAELTGLGLASVKAEGASIVYDTPGQGPETTFTHVTYGLGFIMTREAEGGQPVSAHRREQHQGADLVHVDDQGNRPRQRPQPRAPRPAMSAATAWPGSASHPTANGTQSNLLTAADLSEASLEDAMTTIMRRRTAAASRSRCAPFDDRRARARSSTPPASSRPMVGGHGGQ